MRRAQPRRLRWGRERARICPALVLKSAPRLLRRGRERARMCPARDAQSPLLGLRHTALGEREKEREGGGG